MSTARATVSHPWIWTVLYLPFGAVTGFVSTALTYLATKQGLSITQAAFLTAASLLSQWLKWIWAPAVDVSLTPKKWYLIGTITSGLGVLAMASTPMSKSTLPLLLAVVGSVSLLRSFVGMALESMVAQLTPPEDRGRVSGWFQVGNLAGSALGGGLGLTLLVHLPHPWMAGATFAFLFALCSTALLAVPHVESHAATQGTFEAFKGVVRDLGALARTKGGILVTLLCFLPFGTGAAASVLSQAGVAGVWHASADDVAFVAGYVSAVVVAAGCLAGGSIARKLSPRTAYIVCTAILALVAIALAVAPHTRITYIVGNLAYSFAVGLCFASWTAAVFDAMGATSAATKYTVFASLSNFPNWWLGLLLGVVAQGHGPHVMLLVEGAIGLTCVALYAGSARLLARTRLPDELAA